MNVTGGNGVRSEGRFQPLVIIPFEIGRVLAHDGVVLPVLLSPINTACLGSSTVAILIPRKFLMLRRQTFNFRFPF